MASETAAQSSSNDNGASIEVGAAQDLSYDEGDQQLINALAQGGYMPAHQARAFGAQPQQTPDQWFSLHFSAQPSDPLMRHNLWSNYGSLGLEPPEWARQVYNQQPLATLHQTQLRKKRTRADRNGDSGNSPHYGEPRSKGLRTYVNKRMRRNEYLIWSMNWFGNNKAGRMTKEQLARESMRFTDPSLDPEDRDIRRKYINLIQKHSYAAAKAWMEKHHPPNPPNATFLTAKRGNNEDCQGRLAPWGVWSPGDELAWANNAITPEETGDYVPLDPDQSVQAQSTSVAPTRPSVSSLSGLAQPAEKHRSGPEALSSVNGRRNEIDQTDQFREPSASFLPRTSPTGNREGASNRKNDGHSGSQYAAPNNMVQSRQMDSWDHSIVSSYPEAPSDHHTGVWPGSLDLSFGINDGIQVQAPDPIGFLDQGPGAWIQSPTTPSFQYPAVSNAARMDHGIDHLAAADYDFGSNQDFGEVSNRASSTRASARLMNPAAGARRSISTPQQGDDELRRFHGIWLTREYFPPMLSTTTHEQVYDKNGVALVMEPLDLWPTNFRNWIATLSDEQIGHWQAILKHRIEQGDPNAELPIE